jgi:hypothetical protein
VNKEMCICLAGIGKPLSLQKDSKTASPLQAGNREAIVF